jgi:hypothetical protein
LQEAATTLEKPWLNEVSEEMTAAGDKWREFSMIAGRIFKDRAGIEESYQSAALVLEEVADMEEKIFRKLKEI